jgi:hypothetical protein
VIPIDFNTGNFSTAKNRDSRIDKRLKAHLKKHAVTCENTQDIPSCFSEVIENIFEKHQQKVVILIDECDKPILDNIHNKAQALAQIKTQKYDEKYLAEAQAKAQEISIVGLCFDSQDKKH